MEPAFNVNLLSFGQVLAAKFRQLAKCHDPVPFYCLLFFSGVFVFPCQGSGDGKSGDGEPVF